MNAKQKAIGQMIHMKNTAYIFIPFLFDDPNHFRPLVQALDQSAHWEPKADKAGYLLKYVAGKFDRQNPDLCHCFHCSLHDQARERFGLFRDDTVFSTSQHHCFGSDRTRFSFRILSVHLFCFSTTLCIFAFQLSMESSDPFQISAAEYYLKKVGKEIISPLDAPDQATTLLKLSSRLAEEIPYVSPDSFFFSLCQARSAQICSRSWMCPRRSSTGGSCFIFATAIMTAISSVKTLRNRQRRHLPPLRM